MIKKILPLFLLLSIFSACEVDEPEKKEEKKKPEVIDETKENTVKWSKWQDGYLDIHHLSTGAGDCIYMIMPDGTTMMVDAGNKIETGDSYPGQLPNSNKTTGEWITDYVNHFATEASFTNPKHVDYLLVTHFHDDHVGSISSTSKCTLSSDKTYKMTGVSRVANLLKIGKIIDRDYPDYCNPVGTSIYDDPVTQNYVNFITSYSNPTNGGTVEKFEVGSNTQFKTLKKEVSGFEIRNVYSTGRYWNKFGATGESTIPTGATADELRENLMSCVIKVSYGNFDYHCGGDIETDNNDDTTWSAVEKKVGTLVGETDVIKLDHHGNDNSTCKDFIEATSPQAFIATIRRSSYPANDVCDRLIGQSLYSGSKDLYCNYMSSDKEEILSKRSYTTHPSGHTVVRVYPGGATFRIFVFDYSRTDFYQVYSSKLYTSR